MDFSLISSPIRTFQSMIQCAINTSETIPKEDLIVALRSSLNLLERIGELMSHNMNNKSSPCGLIYNTPNIDQNSFLNAFTNQSTENSFCSQSSPIMMHKESILFSNRIPFTNQDSTPVTSSGTFAALNGLMRNGILSNNENLLNSTSLSDENNSGHNSENPSEINSSYIHQASKPIDKKVHQKQPLWHNRSRSPPVSLVLKTESTAAHDSLSSLKSKPERRKNMNSDELNRLLDSCEVKTGSFAGKKNYKCKFCGKMYDIKSSIRYHIRIIHLKMHLKTADMQCKLCGRVFTCATAANKHQVRCLKICPVDVETRQMENGADDFKIEFKESIEAV